MAMTTPAIVHYIHGPSGLKPNSVELIGDNIQWTYNLTVPAGQTVQLAYFTIVSPTRTEAIAAAHALVTRAGFDGQATAFLSSADVASLGNFQFPPITATVSLNAHSPLTNDVLTATATKSDADGDPVSLTYVWKVNGTVQRTFTSATALSDTFDLSVAGNGSRGDTVTVEVTPSDGTLTGTTVTDTATVADARPTAAIVLNTHSPLTNDVLTATATKSDADGDPVSLTYVWKVNGTVQRTFTSATALSDTFDLSLAGDGSRGDTVTVEVTPSDGTLNWHNGYRHGHHCQYTANGGDSPQHPLAVDQRCADGYGNQVRCGRRRGDLDLCLESQRHGAADIHIRYGVERHF